MSASITRLAIADVAVIDPPRFADPRGVFVMTWNRSLLEDAGIWTEFVQDNHSVSTLAGTVRGLHCQVGDAAQGKLVRVVRGAVWDVAVDVRPNSSSYGHHVAATLSAANWRQMWIPPGFLHGFCTLEPETEVLYKVTAPYDRAAERGVLWNDPALGIDWPVAAADAVLSERDRVLPVLAAVAL